MVATQVLRYCSMGMLLMSFVWVRQLCQERAIPTHLLNILKATNPGKLLKSNSRNTCLDIYNYLLVFANLFWLYARTTTKSTLLLLFTSSTTTTTTATSLRTTTTDYQKLTLSIKNFQEH